MAVHCPCIQEQSSMRNKAMDVGGLAEKGSFDSNSRLLAYKARYQTSDLFIRASAKSRKLLPSFGSTQDYLNNYS